jgi:tetratricopeptide (TPR) repeat protein
MADARDAASFSAEQVAGLLGLGAAQLRAFVRNGFVDPIRGPRGELRFSFQDLVFLRVVARLAEARISPRRMERAVRGLRARLPEDRPLSGVRLSAAGAHVVVREHDRTWSPESGQYWFEFDGGARTPDAAEATPSRLEPDPRPASEPVLQVTATAEGWYVFGCEIEASNPDAARDAYARALELDPKLAEAHVNWGCLEHEAGRLAEAEAQYRAALAIRPDDATAAFDLAVVLEDLGRGGEARAAYETALALDADCADAHFNLARLCDRLGEPSAALRHLQAYRKLTQS